VKLHQALGTLKQASGEFQTFAMDTQDPTAKEMYTRFSQQLDRMVQELSGRVNYVESQEPTYRMDNMVQSAYRQQPEARAREYREY